MSWCKVPVLWIASVLSALAQLRCQVQWWRPPVFSGRDRSCLAYDSVRGRTVLFGGQSEDGSWLDETWEWDGTLWTQRFPAHRPAPRQSAMAFDSGRGVVVLFGGLARPQLFGDTWEWDGTDWTQRTPATAPPARTGHGMAYDSARGRTVMWDGWFDTLVWEWDGNNWSSHATPYWPGAGPWTALAYDARRQRTLIAGADPWEWDGTTWTYSMPPIGPEANRPPGFAYDVARDRTVFAGTTSAGFETWEWDGTTRRWTHLFPAHHPPMAYQHAAAYDAVRQRVVAMGAMDRSTATWEWDGTDWRERAPCAAPLRSLAVGVAPEAWGRTVLLLAAPVGQALATWQWDGTRWTLRTPQHLPTTSLDLRLAFDQRRGRVVLFQGRETWEWDGTDWQQARSAVAPPARSNHALAYDEVRGQVVLFGGVAPGTGQLLGDTWEWDGVQWTQRNPARAPAARAGHAMAFDPVRNRVVLVGGGSNGTMLDDLWEWDGSQWTDRSPAVRPPARSGGTLATDPERRRVVLFGGEGTGFRYFADVWEWDGAQWLARGPLPGPAGRAGAVAVADPSGNGLLLFGGSATGVTFADTWRYAPQFPATWISGGPGCAGSAGTPALAPVVGGRPWLGDALLLQLTQLVPGRSALVWLGHSDQAWGAVPLPLDLTAAGLPGCALRIAPLLALPVFNLTGRTGLEVAVPTDPGLLGQALYTQALAADPGANAFGAVLSNGGTLRIGAR